MDEGWGGDSKRVHYIRDGKAICGRVPADFDPRIASGIDRKNGTHDWCKRCMKLTGTIPMIIMEIGMRIDYGRPAARP